MKRSEMLKIMSKAYGSKNYVYFTEEDADNVLKAMEAAGMLPPEVKEWIEVCHDNILGGGFKVSHNVSKWEAEDETK